MIAFYDNALPIAYTTMRQHARRAKHTTLLAHHMDIMSQVRAEVNSRAPAPHAFAAAVAPASSGVTPLKPAGANADADKTCLRCGRLGHTRRTCRQPKASCTHCNADHLLDFCPKGTGARRRELPDILRGILDRDVQRGSGSAAKTGRKPPTTAAPAPAPASVAPPPAPWQQPTPTAHAAAVQAAATQADPQSAANAYAAALRACGYGLMTHLDFHAYFGFSAAWPRRYLPAAPPFCSSEDAAVDSMASLMIVNSVDKLYRVTDASPKLEIETADGLVPVTAVGVALTYLRVGNSWECYEIPDVMVLEKCALTLYSTRIMHALFARDMLVELAIPLGGPSVIWSDSKSAVDMSRDPVAFKMTKHILRAAEFLRDLVARLVIEVRHLPGRVMIADLLTKAVARVMYHELLRLFDAYAASGEVCPA